MNDIKRAAADILSQFDGEGLPRQFTEKYDQLECLSHSHGTETFLARDRATEKLYVARLTRGEAEPDSESGILKGLHHDGLPAFADEFRSGDSVCVVREYIAGVPLNEYAAKNRLSARDAADIGMGLCDILEYLHGQHPPVIHRDIKPQNIIVRPDRSIALIDFDISRFYSDGADADTQYLGTRDYAPPEQYGFTQTDCRTDIYAVGVLLRWMLAGSEKDDPACQLPAPFRRVIEKSTAFAPKDRYPSAAALKKAISAAARWDAGAARRRVFTLALAALMLCAGFALGRYTDVLMPGAKAPETVFAHPLVEQAVRTQLGKAPEETLTEDDLLSVREIYIFGTETAPDEQPFAAGLGGENGDKLIRGDIASLDDLRLLPNLEVCYVNYQILTDISALGELRSLRRVDLRHTGVEDVSALTGSLDLETVSLYDTNVSDTRCLDSCPRLEHLELGETLIGSLDQVGGAGSLSTLSLKALTLDSLEGLERFTSLERLCLNRSSIGDFSAIARLEGLVELEISEDMLDALSPMAEERGFSLLVS